MRVHPPIFSSLKSELLNGKAWLGRALVLLFAAFSGLTVVGFTWLGEYALSAFHALHRAWWWAPVVWTPLSMALIVWLTRRYVPGVAGSGIPQVMAALEPEVADPERGLFVSLKLTLAKILLTTWGLLAGLSLGREGPSVQIAAGVMHHARRWIPASARISDHGLLVAGGAAGIAAAFNTPLGGVIFAIEELSRHPERRSHSLVLAAIVLSGLVAVSIYGNVSYFGVIHIDNLSTTLVVPALLVALASGLAGGIFARLLVVCTAGTSRDVFTRFRAHHPVWFAAGCGLVLVALGFASDGATYGSGYSHTRGLLEDQGETFALYMPFKFIATWLTTWAGVPGGIFAPALAIGAALGKDVALLTSYVNAPTLIALGMAGFLAAVTQAPLTAFIIVMEMVDGHALVLSLMTCVLVSTGISRLISAPLYASLAQLQLRRLPQTRP